MTTTLTAAITREQAFLPVDVGLNPGLAQIDTELVLIKSGSPGSTFIEVERGYMGTKQDVHSSSTTIYPLIVPGQTGQPVAPPAAHGVQSVGVAVANVAGSVVAGGTGATGGAWDTAGHRDTSITTITEIKTQLNALLASLRTSGIIDT